MNHVTAYLKRELLSLLTAVAISCAMTSCDNAIYDEEGDCAVTYRLAFRYDRNMKWADAFSNEVKSVHLYAFDKEGILVWQHSERGESLKANDYTMPIDLPSGDYQLVAWCGLENDEEELPETFSVPEARVGETKIGELQCHLNREHDAYGAYSDRNLYPLFHGMLNVNLPTDDIGGDYTYTMELTKDTNHVRIILQQLSGEPVDEKDFTFRIEEANGLMNFDNSLLKDEKITYKPYNVTLGTAGLGIDDYPVSESGAKKVRQSRTITSVSVAIADLTIARLMEDRKTMLTIETTEGQKVAQIPLTDYALLLKDGYGNKIGNQEYLDRQDEYALTFFLDEDNTWIGTSIIINSWKVVLNDVDFGK